MPSKIYDIYQSKKSTTISSKYVSKYSRRDNGARCLILNNKDINTRLAKRYCGLNLARRNAQRRAGGVNEIVNMITITMIA